MKGSIALCAHKDCLLFLFPLPDLDIAELSEPAAVTKLLNPDIHGRLGLIGKPLVLRLPSFLFRKQLMRQRQANLLRSFHLLYCCQCLSYILNRLRLQVQRQRPNQTLLLKAQGKIIDLTFEDAHRKHSFGLVEAKLWVLI